MVYYIHCVVTPWSKTQHISILGRRRGLEKDKNELEIKKWLKKNLKPLIIYSAGRSPDLFCILMPMGLLGGEYLGVIVIKESV